MKLFKWFLVLIVCVLAVFALQGCHYRSINGDLDGQWQLMTIDEYDVTQAVPYRVYYCINMHTINLTTLGGVYTSGNIQYDKEDGVLVLELPYEADLARWGLPDSPCVAKLDIIYLDKDKLVVEVGGTGRILEFRKF